MKRYDFVVVGSGLYGAVLAERLHKAGKSLLVIEKRHHVGGNCYSYEFPQTNITVHKYGPHIFHCTNEHTWRYVNGFSDFNRYHHRVLATHRNKTYSLPINLGTVNAFYRMNLKPYEVRDFLATRHSPIPRPRNLEEMAISLVGEDLYAAFIRGYTKKQWGRDPKTLPAEIIMRLPVRFSYDDSYYMDYYQGLPRGGYAALFENILKGIRVELNTDFFDDVEHWRRCSDRLIYTGPIDRFFEYCLGRLGWRSVRFEHELLSIDDFQGISVMNYPDEEVPFTRIIEPKHFHPEKAHSASKTVIIREYPHDDPDEPYYPINSREDRALFAEYRRLVEEEPRIVFGGRLADYRYYDMHHVVEAALTKAQELI